MQCHEVASFLARRADDAEALAASVRAEVDQHVAGCAACRAELEAQRAVVVLLRARPADRLSPQFGARLSSRLDDAAGWFGIADWRVWTLRLAPVAAALALATYLGLGVTSQTSMTLDDWTTPTAETSTESVLWEPDVSADSVVETMLMGELPSTAGESGNVR
jgi:anti-sigma factor RsiW